MEIGTAIGVTAGLEVVRQAKKLGVVKRALVKFVPKHKVLLIGSSGAGKTNLIYSLGESIPEAIDRFNRTKESKSYIFNIEGKYFQIGDVPGHERHESKRKETIQESLRKVEGILHIVCYGYHEGSNIRLKDAIIDEINPNQEFLEKQRKEEINNLIELSQYYSTNSKVKWFVTVISKADLWWEDREEVLDYYNSGEYNKVFSESLPGLNRSYIEYCSVIHMFYDKLKLSGTFDDKAKRACRNKFISTLIDMISAKKRNKIF